jgi:apolipoprotein N-acyltransferase
LLLAAAWPPWDLSYLVWVALVPWFCVLARQPSAWRAFAVGWWLHFVIGLAAAYWVATAAHEFLELSWGPSVVVLLFFAAMFAHPHVLFVAPLVRWGAREAERGVGSALLVCLCLAALYTGLDTLVPRLFDAGIGCALHDARRLRQLADLGGEPLLTFVVVLVNLLVWRSWAALRTRKRVVIAAVPHLLLIGAIGAGALLYGESRSRAFASALARADEVLQVGIVQGNVPNDVRLAWARGDERSAEKQLASYMLPTEELAGQTPTPAIIVWPEATFPGIFGKPQSTLQRGRANKFDRQVMRLQRPIVFGAYDFDTRDGHPTLYNALFAITPRYDAPGTPGTVQRYFKHRLLPFAETIPGLSKTEWLRKRLPSLGFFGAGPGPGRFEVTTPDGRSVVLGPFICSESLSIEHVAETARRGVDVLLNVGSDGWFGRFGEPQFHLAVAQLRSVETRRPQIRAANTGISALILPSGEIVARSPLAEEATLNGALPLAEQGDSLVLRWGNWFGNAALVAGLLLALALAFMRRASGRAARRGGR